GPRFGYCVPSGLCATGHVSAEQGADNAEFADRYVIVLLVVVARVRQDLICACDTEHVLAVCGGQPDAGMRPGSNGDRDAEAQFILTLKGASDGIPLFHVDASAYRKGGHAVSECDRHYLASFLRHALRSDT